MLSLRTTSERGLVRVDETIARAGNARVADAGTVRSADCCIPHERARLVGQGERCRTDELRLCGPAPNGLLPARRAEAF
jgi:hypothetical protein